MAHINPVNVVSPRDYISNVHVLYHDPSDEGFSIAEVTWANTKVIAIRWNASMRELEDVTKTNQIYKGNPTSRGYPTWFVLPDIITKDPDFLKTLIKKHRSSPK